MEVYCFAARKDSMLKKFLMYAALVFGGICLIGSAFMGLISLALGIVLLVVGSITYIRRDVEFEVSYFDGEIRMAKVFHKSSRKNLPTIQMEDVEVIAPPKDAKISYFENDSSVKVEDYTSKQPNVKYYEIAVNAGGVKKLYKVEVDDEFLNSVRKKYFSKVVSYRY